MTNVGIPILMYAAYNAPEKQYRNLQKITPEIANTYASAPVAELTPIYKDITFKDIIATTQKGKRAGLIWGLPEAMVSNILLQNVIISAEDPFGIFYAQNVRLENCTIITSAGKNKPETTHAQVFIDGKEFK